MLLIFKQIKSLLSVESFARLNILLEQGYSMPSEYSCIYCSENKIEAEFSKDHVVPKCFGTFEPDSMTLINTVCSDCNQYFGDNLELYLGRDTLEGVTRFNYEIFPSGKSSFRRLIFKIERPNPLFGMLVSPKPQLLEGLPEIELLDQVGFFSTKTRTYEYFLNTNIPERGRLEEDGFNFDDHEIRLIGDYDKSRQVLMEMGYPNNSLREEALFKTPEDKKNIPVIIKSRIDRTIARGMAKIAFNYLAYITNSAFVLGRDFETIRRFIRYDDGDFDEVFRVDKKPILRKERELRKRLLDGHIIVIDWHDDDLNCSLAIFNRIVQITYYFRLSKRHSGVWIPICSGHYFDVAQNKIWALYNIKKLIVPDSYWTLRPGEVGDLIP